MLKGTGLHLSIIAVLINLKNWFGQPIDTLPVIGLAVPSEATWLNPVLYAWFGIAILLYVQLFIRNGFSAMSGEYQDVAHPHYEHQAVMSDYERVTNGGNYEPSPAAKAAGVCKLLIWYPIKLLLLSPVALGFLLPVFFSVAAVASIFLA